MKAYKLKLALLVTMLATFAGLVRAQSGVPVGIVDSPCPSTVAASSEFEALKEELLKPNNKFTSQYINSLFNSKLYEEAMRKEREQRERDWPYLCKYKADNAALDGKQVQAVFIGDSITENWVRADSAFFNNNVGRGISGQTTPQIVLRFYQDVIALHPRAVHIMVGTNDLAGRTGPTSLQDYQNNILTMLDLAQSHGIKVVLAGIPPAKPLPGSPDHASLIRKINSWLQRVASDRKLVFVDYAAVLADAEGHMQDSLSNDGLHPTQTGYAQMRPLAERALAQVLKR